MIFEKKEEESICGFLLRAFQLSNAKMHFAIKKRKTHSIGLFITIYIYIYRKQYMSIFVVVALSLLSSPSDCCHCLC